MDDEEEEEITESDARIMYIYQYLSKTLRFKVDRWMKMMGVDEYKALINKFLNDETMQKLVMTITGAGVLVPLADFPSANKNKLVYFLRLEPVIVTEENIRDVLLIGDMSTKSLEEFQVYLENLWIPLLQSGKTVETWGQNIIEEVKKKAFDTRDDVYRIRGVIDGLTLLPMPEGIERILDKDGNIISDYDFHGDFRLTHDIEMVVHKWGEQVNKVYHDTARVFFDREKEPFPTVDLSFWSGRLKNFENLYMQLKEPKVIKMASILEKEKSKFYDIFKSVFQSVVSGLDEARSIDRYLSTLKKHLDALDATDLFEASELFIPLIYTICLIWINCPYFNRTDQMITLMKEICNFIILQSEKCLDPPAMFAGEVEETLPKLRKVIENMKYFRKIFIQYQEDIPGMYLEGEEPKPWTFHHDIIFQEKYDIYICRLELIESIFVTCVDYLRLEKVEVGGWSGGMLSGRLFTLFEEFNNLYGAWLNIQYSPTDLENDGFHEDYENWKKKIYEFDARLAAVINIAFDECTNFEQIFKFIHLFGPLLERELVVKELDSKYERIVFMYDAELDDIKTIYDVQMKKLSLKGQMEVPNYWPPIAGGLCWLRDLRKRLEYPLDWLTTVTHRCVKTEKCKYILKKASQMSSILDDLQYDLYDKWCSKIGDVIEEKLDQCLLKFDNDCLLVLNFDPKLRSVLREVRYLRMLEVPSIPPAAEQVFDRMEEFYDWRVKLMYIVEWYNNMMKESRPQEINIISDEINSINSDVETAMETINWKSDESAGFIDTFYLTVEGLTQRAKQARENLERVEWLMNQFNFIPVYRRIDNDDSNFLDYITLSSVEARYECIIAAGYEIFDLINLNFRLLHNLPIITFEDEMGEEEIEEEEGEEEEIDETMFEPPPPPVEEEAGEFRRSKLDLKLFASIIHGSQEDMLGEGEGEGEEEEEEVEGEIFPSLVDEFEFLTEEEKEQRRKELLEEEEKKREEEAEKKRKEEEALERRRLRKEKEEKRKKYLEELLRPVTPSTEESMQFDRPALRARYLFELWKVTRLPVRPPGQDIEEEAEEEFSEEEEETIHLGKSIMKKKKTLQSVYGKKKLKIMKKKGVKGKPTKKGVKGEAKKGAKEVAKKDVKVMKGKKVAKKKDGIELLQTEGLETILYQAAVEGPTSEDPEVIEEEDLYEEEMEEDYWKPPTASMILFEEFRNNPEKLKKWDDYLDLVDQIVQEGLLHAVGGGVAYLSDEMEERKKRPPLFLLRMMIENDIIQFIPSMVDDESDPESLVGIMWLILEDIKCQALLVPRISYKAREKSYLDDIILNEDIIELEKDIKDKVAQSVVQAGNFAEFYRKYAYLWLDDRKEQLKQFLKYGRVLEIDELELQGKVDEEDKPYLEEKAPTLADFKAKIDVYEELEKELEAIPDFDFIECWLKCDLTSFKERVLSENKQWDNLYKDHLFNLVVDRLLELDEFINRASEGMSIPLVKGDYEGLVTVMGYLFNIRDRTMETDEMFDEISNVMNLLKQYGIDFSEKTYSLLKELPIRWADLKIQATLVKTQAGPLMQEESNTIRKRLSFFDIRQNLFLEKFKNKEFFRWDCTEPYEEINKCDLEIGELEKMQKNLCDQAALFEVAVTENTIVENLRKQLYLVKVNWDYIIMVLSMINNWENTKWKTIDSESMDLELKKFAKEIRTLDRDMRNWDIYLELESAIKNLLTALRAITELQNPAIKERHWHELMVATEVTLQQYYEETKQQHKVKFVIGDDTTLKDLLELNLYKYEEEVKTIVDKSVKEQAMEKTLRELEETWANIEFEWDPHERTGIPVLRVTDTLIEQLESDQVNLQNMLSSKFVEHFHDEVSSWQKKLSMADQVINTWNEVQRTWSYLEAIFIGSDDIRRQLPEDTKRFDNTDRAFKGMLNDLAQIPKVVEGANRPNLLENLNTIQKDLTKCEKAMSQYLETKRMAYPRFYFLSVAVLLDILANSNFPERVCKNLSKLYDSIEKLHFKVEGGQKTKLAIAMEEKNGERVSFSKHCDCNGQVERWLNNVTDSMRMTGRDIMSAAIKTYDEKPREEWMFEYPAQFALLGTQIWWVTEVTIAFGQLGEGYENAMKDYQKKQINQLNVLINLLLGELSEHDREEIMTICTQDVHSRDIVAKLIAMKVESSLAFQWQSQLRHRWDLKINDCLINICDAMFRYDYEYLGNERRLVITPLTDRCYITLTQSLHLVMGGAPAGPAGTGKTETTKDLGKALGMRVYVFNCSEQMDYQSLGNNYKGLSQTGAWGCFDEFNRISVEVLSVVAVQVKTVLDAIKSKKIIFNFMGEMIKLVPTVGMFITMNPGYAGRAELPENLKALFRPCAMVVPDFELISEINLIAQGFQEARPLAKKFLTLYSLCRELLSKQDHYDWGLRAIKSVLVVAGSLKRADPFRPEDQVLMRALRDFNTPKIVTDDRSIFMGLIGDLFPSLDVPRKRDLEFEKECKQGAIDMKLQPEDSFVLKMVQLQELFDVRHSVFIIGDAGTGKSMVWKTLHRTYANMKLKPHYNDLEPKAVTNDELFGVINPQTREWKDGLFSVLIREQANMGGDGPKWMVMDGDIDPMWIESLNTVMDDNKVLTLASNERIALTKHMRLLFEISNLKTATPATVSRAGILFINPIEVGWTPCAASWVDTRKDESERTMLQYLIDKYIPSTYDVTKTRFKKITPIPAIAHIHMLCSLLECLLVPANVSSDSPREWYETYFVFATVWAFGSAMFQDQLLDWRNEFTKWWINEFKTIKFPPDVYKGAAQVFSYFVDQETKKFRPWSDLVHKFELDYDIPLQSTQVDTSETTRIRYFLDLLIEKRKAIMLIAPAGAGKSVVIYEKLNSLTEDYAITNIPFNFYTTSEILQKILEKPLEKKAGRNYGPQGNKTMIYFIDDLNMPEVDLYGTVQPHTLIRQYMDYHHWYDRQKLTLKDIHNVMFMSCMNPTAGSFTINSRLQRHFMTFALSFPEEAALTHIYTSILNQHIGSSLNKFSITVLKTVDMIVKLALLLHAKIATTFLPTAIKFHYIFNLRDLSNVFQSVILTNAECIHSPGAFVRLWMHETLRVYHDKLIDHNDQDTFCKVLMEIVKKNVQDIGEHEYMVEPLIFTHFVDGLGDPKYLQMPSWPRLNKILVDAMGQYNELVANMNLVLFEDAMAHVCRINRVMEMPRGNALLVGIGGSGKQSLSRLSAFISSLEAFQVQLKKGYAIADLKGDLAGLYLKAGIKNMGIMFLMTDSQVAEERFLVQINDMLASGEIPELFADDEIENIIQAITPETKGAGLVDTRENCWKFFIDRVRRNLKVILCFSPVGSTLRVRARKFPALVNCTTIDWFMEWPKEALESVSSRFLAEVEVLSKKLVKPLSNLMAFMHTTVNDMSQQYLLNERRYNYTTPKSFLELINLYSKLLTGKNKEVNDKIGRLQNGLQKLVSCSEQVAVLKKQLAVQDKIVQQKNAAATLLIEEVAVEKDKVQKEQAIATEEARRVRIIEEDVTIKQKVCEEDLAKAEPALAAAKEALNTLNKTNLTEMKSFGTPPEAVARVASAVMVLLAKKGKIPKDRSWKAAKAIMGSADSFLSTLINYNKENIHPDIVKAIQPYINDPQFTPENVITKSSAAAGLCSWVINIMKFHAVWCVVLPKRKALAAANAELANARQRLQAVKERIAMLEEQFGKLMKKYNTAMSEKRKCEMEVQKTAEGIDLANRLVNGLASENTRWRQSVSNLRVQLGTLPGDIILVTAFISYVGSFTRSYREDMVHNYWIPQLPKYSPPIPMTKDLDPMCLLTDDAQVAEWNNQGLPNDRMSAENATILINSERWPLMIDPQLQGIKWIKTRYKDALRVIRLGQDRYLDKVEKAVWEGATLLIEYISENIDPVLDNLLGRALIRKGRVVKIGDREIDFHPSFRLLLHTKLANPHYRPEIQAQTTLINFTVTQDGLEDQLLAEVVNAERPDLESQKSELTMQQNMFKITLKRLEDDLLQRLSSAGPDILEDRALVLNLESTKKTAEEIQEKVEESKITSKNIDNAREIYRPVATRASIIYFIMNDLNKINPLYQFSLKAFSIVFNRAIKLSEASPVIQARVENLIDSISFSTFMYTSRGLFECDKLTFMAQLTIQIMLRSKEITRAELDFLLRFPYIPNEKSPVDFLTDVLWGGILALSKMEVFENLDRDIDSAKKRWQKFCEGENPERDKLPQDWKNKTVFQRLCIMRSLRPDRMTYATRCFIEEVLGPKFTHARTVEFEKSFEEMTPTMPCFFILSPGVDPTRDVERVGKRLGFTTDRRNFHNVSLGQGQELVAENAMEMGSKYGHWVILQNIHLVTRWLPTLDKKMEAAQVNPHRNFKLFLSSEPAPDPSLHRIPQGVLESSIKITNEPPTGMMANLHKALDNFNQATLEMCSKEAEFKAILFSLCYFHAVVAERRKFGPQGWNRSYPFNVGDLTISVQVLYNYLENNAKIPWEDLRYLFGEIMYGGHITDDWDRRLCRTYLEEYMCPDLVEAELYYAPQFPAPPNSDYTGYHMYIDAMLPQESPVLYGLHPNAEIGFLTTQSENLFQMILELQPRESGAAASGGLTREEKVGALLSDILDRVPEPFNITDMMARVEDRSPYTIVAFQECERMNILMREIKRSLDELRLGLKGELTFSSEMETLEFNLFMDKVPTSWANKAYPSLLGLSAWFSDLTNRLKDLEIWVGDFQLPTTVWLGGFFNPQSFLTAIMQNTARKNEWPLDKMCLQCDVTRKIKEEMTAAPREGAYISNLYCEGARWDITAGVLTDAIIKDLFPSMPVIHVRAVTQDKQDTKNIYECPVYKTRQRGPTFVWTFNLKTKAKPAKWTLAGVALLLST